MDLKQYKVLVTGPIRPCAYEYLKDRVTLVHQQKQKLTREEYLKELADADALFVSRVFPISNDDLAVGKRLKMIGLFSVGHDHVDMNYCRSRGIKVSNTPGISVDGVADIGYGLIIDAARQIVRANAFVHAGRWGRREFFGVNTSLAGKTLGIIGMGSIGGEIALRARASKMKIIYFNKHQRADEDRFGATYVELEELLHRADFVVLSVALTPETEKMINANTLAMMKPTAALINVARGKVVDTEALYEALKNGVIRYAAADVIDPEPLPGEHKILTLDNFVVTPHIASATKEIYDNMALHTAENIVAFFEGKPLLSEVK